MTVSDGLPPTSRAIPITKKPTLVQTRLIYGRDDSELDWLVDSLVVVPDQSTSAVEHFSCM